MRRVVSPCTHTSSGKKPYLPPLRLGLLHRLQTFCQSLSIRKKWQIHMSRQTGGKERKGVFVFFPRVSESLSDRWMPACRSSSHDTVFAAGVVFVWVLSLAPELPVCHFTRSFSVSGGGEAPTGLHKVEGCVTELSRSPKVTLEIFSRNSDEIRTACINACCGCILTRSSPLSINTCASILVVMDFIRFKIYQLYCPLMQHIMEICLFAGARLTYNTNTVHKITLYARKEQETTTNIKIFHISNAIIHLICVFKSVSGKENV